MHACFAVADKREMGLVSNALNIPRNRLMYVRVAQVTDLPIILGLFQEAEAWLNAKNISLWPWALGAEAEDTAFWYLTSSEPKLDRTTGAPARTVYVVEDGRGPYATFWLALADPDQVWPGPQWDTAVYAGNLIVSRGRTGQGPDVLAWISEEAIRLSRRAVRLSVPSNAIRLANYFRHHGFEPVGQVNSDPPLQLLQKPLVPR